MRKTDRRAAERAPDSDRYAYIYGVALNSIGRTNKAIGVLAAAQRRQPNDRELLYALATMSRHAGQIAAARGYVEKLTALAPHDPDARNLHEQLKR